MSQSLELNLKTTSDVPEAVDKAKQAVAGFSKQVDEVNKKTTQKTKQETAKTGSQIEDIKKKFSTSFKDIFLSMLGPMALFTGAVALIGRLIEDNQKKQEDANKAAIEGSNALMSAEDRYYANKLNNEKKDQETVEQAKVARQKVTQDFLENDPRGKQIYDEAYREKFFGHPFQKTKRGLISDDPDIQAKVQAIIAEDARRNPGLGVNPSAKKDFKGPEGFSNVIGVGPNPVIEAMAKQTEIALAQLAELQKISGSTPGVPTDFTKESK